MSEEALKDLGVIGADFPKANTFPLGAVAATAMSEGKKENVCDCPQRGEVPSLPTEMPLPGNEENVEGLRAWLLDYYGSTGFNTCEHQPIPEMAGPPLDITLEEGATPVAVHSPIPIPHHWKYRVKSELDRDVMLGVIKPVPTGTPTDWCSRMVVTPKHDGAPPHRVSPALEQGGQAGDTPHPESLQPGEHVSAEHEEDGDRCVEWISCDSVKKAVLGEDYIPDRVGKITLPPSTTRVSSIRSRPNQVLRCHHGRCG